MKTKIAHYISAVGHPLLTIPVFTIVALFTYEDFQRALSLSLLILGGVFIPLVIKTYRGTKDGTYTNFDVSNKKERQSWYVSALVLLLILTFILFITDQPRSIRLNVFFSFLLLFTSQMVNYFIKSSLHVSLNIFITFLIMPMNLTIGLLFLSFVPLIAWSRWTLKRHTLIEIISGAIIGLVIGFMTLLYI